MPWFAESRLGKLVYSSSFRRNVITLVSGTALAQLIVLLSYPVVTRLFDPETMGLLLVLLAFTGLWSKVCSLRYDSAIVIARDNEEVAILIALAAGLALLMSLLAGPVVLVLISSDTLGFGELPKWVAWVIVPVLFGQSLFAIFRTWCVRNGEFLRIGTATVVRAFGNAATRIVGGLLGFGFLALLAAEFVAAYGALTRVAGGWAEFRRANKSALTPTRMATTARYFSRFPRIELPSVAINMLAISLPIPLIAANFGVASAGIFGLAHRLVAIPNGQIGFAVSDVFQMRLAEQVRQGQLLEARSLFNQLTKKLGLIGLVPMIVVMLAAPPLAGWVLGEKWAEVGTVAAVIAPWLYASFVVSTLSRLLSVVERQDLKLIYDIASLACVLLAFFGAAYFELSFLQTLGVLTGFNFLAYVIYYRILSYALSNPFR